LHREAKKPAVAILRWCFGPEPTPAHERAGAPGGCRSIAPRSRDRHRGRDGRGPKPKERLQIATIGTFTKSENGFTGSVKTLTLNAKTKIAAAETENDKAPGYRVTANGVEFGAAWRKTSREGRQYLSVKLDDPSFPAPIYAYLVEAEDGESFTLIWSRRNGD
jgi:uncharacterized protein (DUF736 family)